MADRWAVATGNWSSAATWNGGTLPTSADDVFADGFTVTIDQNVTVLSIRTTQRTGGTAGGGFVISGIFNINANIIAGTTSPLTCNNGCQSVITGILTASNSMSSQSGVVLVNTGAILTINSASFAGGSSGSAAVIIRNSTPNVTLVGNVASGGLSIRNDNFAVSAATFITIIGSISSGGIFTKDFSNLTFTINGVIEGSASLRLGDGASALILLNGRLGTDANGFLPIVQTNSGNPARLLIHPSDTIEHQYRVNNSGVPGVARSLYTGGVNLNQPTVTNVRSGTVYGASNEFTGTLIVPSAQFVSLGTPVDSGVGSLQYLTMADLQAALAPNSPVIAERSDDDTKALTFSWPASGASILGFKSFDNGAYSSVSGAISYLRTEGARHYYTLAYNAADRSSQESLIRYRMQDGTYTKYFNLRIMPASNSEIISIKAKTDNLPADPASSSQITSLLNNAPMEAF